MKLERAEPVQLMYSLSVKKLRGLTLKRLEKALSVVPSIRRIGFRGRVSEVRILPGPLLVFRSVVVLTDRSFSHSYAVCPWKPLLYPLSYRPTLVITQNIGSVILLSAPGTTIAGLKVQLGCSNRFLYCSSFALCYPIHCSFG